MRHRFSKNPTALTVVAICLATGVGAMVYCITSSNAED